MGIFTVNQGTNIELAAGTLTGGTIIGISRIDIGNSTTLSPWGGTTLVAGTVTGGTIQNLATGTLNALASGTITGGTLGNLVSGTITALAVGTIGGKAASGAAAAANPVQIAGTDVGGTIYSPLIDSSGIQRSSGSQIMTVGTLTTGTLQNLVTGTINALAAGTVTAGTLSNLNYGTINIDPTPNKITPLIQGTLGTAGGSFFGTLSAASGAGTKHYITGLSVIGQTGTVDVRVLAGTSIAGTGVLGAGNVVPGGGYIRDFVIPFATGTNSELTYHFVGAGTAFIIVNYWKGA